LLLNQALCLKSDLDAAKTKDTIPELQDVSVSDVMFCQQSYNLEIGLVMAVAELVAIGKSTPRSPS
jgi:hypothetical protein